MCLRLFIVEEYRHLTQEAEVKKMIQNDHIHIRIDGYLKQRAMQVLEANNLSISKVICSLMEYIANEQRLPFLVRTIKPKKSKKSA